MKTGDLVRYYCKNTENVYFGMFLWYGEKHKDESDSRRAGILLGSSGKLVESLAYLKVGRYTAH